MAWDPQLYLRFGGERTRAAADLLARVPLEAPARITDVGCGPGNSTALVAARYPHADLEGADSSAEMLKEAAASGVKARWTLADFNSWTPATPPDLIFANAAFQWAPDPVALTARLYQTLAPGGVIALQVPQNYDQPSHTVIAGVADGPRWKDKLAGAHRYDPGFARGPGYARALRPLGASVDIWTTEYLHVLEGADPVFRWMSSTGLRPFLEALQGDDRTAFAEDVRAALASAYPPEADGRTFFSFRRLFVVATRP
jgi:trans-aconitate 2-methyltransferase